MKRIFVKIDFKVIDEKYISNFDIEREIFFAVTPDIDLETIILVGLINYLKFLGIVSVGFISVYVRAVNNKANGRVVLLLGRVRSAMVFFVLFTKGSEVVDLSLGSHQFFQNIIEVNLSGRTQHKLMKYLKSSINSLYH